MRVTNMKGVDIHTFDFDFDLTFAALLMHPDGTIYHRYGGRDWTDSQSHLSVGSFTRVLQKTLPEHRAYARKPSPPRSRAALSVDRMPAMVRKPKQPECFHCHNVYDAITEEAQHRGRFRRADVWRYPDPNEVGFSVGKDDQTKVTKVVPTSAADKAGLRVGARLVTLGGQRILTLGDIMRVLHVASPGPAAIKVTFEIDGARKAGLIRPRAGWKEPSPLNFAWRASKWKLSPKPGFGGRQLEAAQLEKLGLARDAFAFRVGYVVTWGPNAHTGRNARKAGIRKGDVILATYGRSDFRSVDEWHAWFRLRLKAGQAVPVKLLRNGKVKTITLPVVD